MANFMTACRILCSILLLCSPAFSPRFHILYLLCGLTDMVDGTIARKTNTASAFGAKFDTAADFLFAGAAFAKLLPVIRLPRWLWIWAAVIAVIKLVNVVSGFVCQKRFVAEHTVMNKITGALLFFWPLTSFFMDLRYSAVVVCCAATFAAIQEGHFIRTGREIV